jgi:hypothetical protein
MLSLQMSAAITPPVAITIFAIDIFAAAITIFVIADDISY